MTKSKYSIEVPKIEKDRERSVSPPDFGFVSLRQFEISAAYNHVLVSDISRFYGTLYTHAIPWALHGKRWSKNNLHSPSFESSLGNRLDIAVRKGQDNQTIGIPVGPDTSRIISEIVGVAIDQFIQDFLKLNRNKAFRHVDDWYIGFDSAGEAENAIATLAIACRKYELELNPEKTNTHHTSDGFDSTWPTELRQHHFGRFSSRQAKSLEHYFVKAFQFSQSCPTENVLNFAVKRTKSILVSEANWRMYESFLLKAARSNVTVIPAVVEILVSYNADGYDLDKVRIAKFIQDVISVSAPLGHHAEVAWVLFLAKALQIRVTRNAAKAVSGLESSVCAMLALDLRANGLVSGQLDTSLWIQSMQSDGLLSNMWLLAYEADLKGWLQGKPKDFVDKHQYFSVLKNTNISFYNTKKNVVHIRKQKPKRPSSAFLAFLDKENISRGLVGVKYLSRTSIYD